MKSLRQFLPLLRFEVSANPYLWLFPLAFLLPGLMMSRINQPSLSTVLANSNFFILGILGASILTPEFFSRGVTGRWGSTDFVVTRAVDRAMIVRARGLLFWLMIGVGPLVLLLVGWAYPHLTVVEYDQRVRQQLMAAFPGAIPSEAKYDHSIFLPYGQFWLQAWNLWSLLLLGAGIEILIWLIYSLKGRLYIFYTAYIILVFTPLFLEILSDRRREVSSTTNFFLAFVAHPLLFGLILITALGAARFWSERRFARLEF